MESPTVQLQIDQKVDQTNAKEQRATNEKRYKKRDTKTNKQTTLGSHKVNTIHKTPSKQTKGYNKKGDIKKQISNSNKQKKIQQKEGYKNNNRLI